MRLCGLVTEYNPFHKGHAYHATQAKLVTGADATVAVMSGHFLQRGEPAIMDKWQRAKLAVQGGVDLVIELPTYYATASAEQFATGAITLLERMGIDHVVFGSESGDLSALSALAHEINNPSVLYKRAFDDAMEEGMAYPAAQTHALAVALEAKNTPIAEFKSNNILGMHYLAAIAASHAHIVPHTIKRIGNDYRDEHIYSEIASATAVRKLLKTRPINWDLLKNVVPQTTFDGIFEYPVYTEFDDFQKLFNAIALIKGAGGIKTIRGNAEGLENKVVAELTTLGTLSDMALAVKSKRYPLTRIQRLFMAILLDTQPLLQDLDHLDYARILAYNENGAKAIRAIKQRSDLFVMTNLARDLKKYRKHNPLLALDTRATGIYAQVNHAIAMDEDFLRRPYGTR